MRIHLFILSTSCIAVQAFLQHGRIISTSSNFINSNLKTKNSKVIDFRGGSILNLSSKASAPEFSIGELKYNGPSDISVKISKSEPNDWSGDLIFLTSFQSEDKNEMAQLFSMSKGFDEHLKGIITDLIETENFKGNPGTSVSIFFGKNEQIKKAVVLGLGKKSDFKEVSSYGTIGSNLAHQIKSSKYEKIGIILPEKSEKGQISKLVEAVFSSLYIDDRYKSSDNIENTIKTKSIDIFSEKSEASEDEILIGKKIALGVNLAKDLVNAPPNFLTPASMADTAIMIAKEHKMECEILEESEIRKMGMGAYLGVSQGSGLPPKFIHLTYTPKGTVKKKLAIVGKGLTFDSGGYNLKAGAGSMIELMKFDMGGAAATLGTAKVIGNISPDNVEVHFIIAACENMISDKAMRPGDILTASNGKTIEVLNTDAEGRLTLADALIYAENQNVDFIVDCATLTGAAIVALGPHYACLYSDNDELRSGLLNSSKKSGDKLWHMPLPAEYNEMIKSKIADLKNVGGKWGGSITAALFLKEFVNDTPWAHIDLAGPVWSEKEGAATGYGVRLLSSWILSHSE